MLSEKMAKALNAQLNAEYYSSYLYLGMAAYLDGAKMPGAGHWMRLQAQEEMTHAMKFYAHIDERGGRVKLAAVEAPPFEWASPLRAFEAAYEHEQKVTGLIADLVKVAESEKDSEAGAFLQWFVKEQEEEEESADEVVQKLRQAGDSAEELKRVDAELGERS